MMALKAHFEYGQFYFQRSSRFIQAAQNCYFFELSTGYPQVIHMLSTGYPHS